MLKVHVLVTCSHCNGEAYLPIGDAEDSQGHKYTRHIPCPVCELCSSSRRSSTRDEGVKRKPG